MFLRYTRTRERGCWFRNRTRVICVALADYFYFSRPLFLGFFYPKLSFVARADYGCLFKSRQLRQIQDRRIAGNTPNGLNLFLDIPEKRRESKNTKDKSRCLELFYVIVFVCCLCVHRRNGSYQSFGQSCKMSVQWGNAKRPLNVSNFSIFHLFSLFPFETNGRSCLKRATSRAGYVGRFLIRVQQHVRRRAKYLFVPTWAFILNCGSIQTQEIS